MRLSNLKKHLQRKRRSARSAGGSSVDRSGWQTRLALKYFYMSVAVGNVVINNKSEKLVHCISWFLRPIWRSWNAFGNSTFRLRLYLQRVQKQFRPEASKWERKIKTFVCASHLSDEFVWVAGQCLSKAFQFGFLPWKPCFFFPRNLLLNSCSTETKSEWTFFSRPSMDQTGFSSAPASIGLWTRVEFAGKLACVAGGIVWVTRLLHNTASYAGYRENVPFFSARWPKSGP